jgi:uncharacterized membrane protein
MGKNRIIAIITLIALPAIVAIGAQLGTIVTPIILIASVIGFIILVCLNKVDSRDYPLYIFAITLGMMWQTTMLGAHIIGSDMAGEFFAANTIAQNGVWHPSLDYGTQSSTSIVVGWLVPQLSNILHIDVVWVFKVILPIIFSLTTVILYYAYRKQIGEKKSALACLFFMIVPIASLEVAQIGKMMVAETFFALTVLLLVIKLKWYWQLACLTASVMLAILSHYTVGFAVIAYLGGILIIRMATVLFKNWRLFKDRIVPIGIVIVVLVITVSGCVAYYKIADNGSIMKVMDKIVPIYGDKVAGMLGIGGNGVKNNLSNEDSSGVLLQIDGAEKEAGGNGYLDKFQNQDVAIKTAVGFDFADASVAGKLFRIVQYITQLLIVAGSVWLVFNFKKYKFTAEFFAGIVASFVLLFCCIFIPGFSLIINATRFYQLALFFIAPMLIISFDAIPKRQWLLPSVMIIYLVFTSGLIFEALKYDNLSKIDVPYSAGLSAERTGVYASYTNDDVNAVKWLLSQEDKESCIAGDYNGTLLVMAYDGVDRIRKKNSWDNYTFDDAPVGSYIILTSWNTQNNRYLDSLRGVCGGAGLRQARVLPEFNYVEVFHSSDAVVLKK